MNALVANIDSNGYVILLLVCVVFYGILQAISNLQKEAFKKREARAVQQKLDAIMKHLGVELPPPPPSGMSPEVERLANDPNGRIAAIKLYREENPGFGLQEAKAKIEEFCKGKP